MNDGKSKTPGQSSNFSEGQLEVPPTDLFQQVLTLPEIGALDDQERFDAELHVDIAHTVMLGEQEIISPSDAAAICGALVKALEKGPRAIPMDPSKDSTLFQIESYLANELNPDIAGKMHTGRSRTDRGAAIMRLHLREQLLQVIESLVCWQEALLKRGEETYEVVLPGYTHMQAAQPITFGHHLLTQFWLHGDDMDRLQSAFKHTNVNALGTASIAGTGWPLDRTRTQELLGFDSCTENARVSRTYIFRAEIASVYALLLATLHYLTSDLYIWFSHEFRMVEPADEHSGSSSIMPQKKNPYVWEKTRVSARHASGWPGSALAALMGASSSDSFLEPPEIERYGPRVSGLMRLNAEVLERLMINKKRMLELVKEQFSTANNLADTLVRERGLPFRAAHNIVGRLVRLAVNKGLLPGGVGPELLDQSVEEVGVAPPRLDPETIYQALDPEAFVRSRATFGSTNPEDVRRQIDAGRRNHHQWQDWLADRKERSSAARDKLYKAVADLST